MFRQRTRQVKPTPSVTMGAPEPTAEVARRANELYWGSDQSVNQIADDLDLSKGALYELVRPLQSGLGCPTCSAEVVYSNRTAKERGRLDCSICGWGGGPDEAALEVDEEEPSVALTGPLEREPRSPDDRFRFAAGGALLGAAVGLAVVLWVRRRA
jgi:hypothetical protein